VSENTVKQRPNRKETEDDRSKEMNWSDYRGQLEEAL
jgi:hypothetical protein